MVSSEERIEEGCVTTRSGAQAQDLILLSDQDTGQPRYLNPAQSSTHLSHFIFSTMPLKRKTVLFWSSALSIICKKNMNQAPHRAPACPQQVGRGHRCEEGPNPKRRKLVSSSEEIKKEIRLCPLLDMNGRCPFGDKCNFAHS